MHAPLLIFLTAFLTAAFTLFEGPRGDTPELPSMSLTSFNIAPRFKGISASSHAGLSDENISTELVQANIIASSEYLITF